MSTNDKNNIKDHNIYKKAKYIGVFGLTILMTSAVDGISNLPSIALFGLPLLFFFITAVIFFLLPVGLISAELCKQCPEDSGVYAWSKKAFGSSVAAFAVWLQWINTMVWFPTCLTTLVGTAAFVIHPSLAQQPVYLVLTSLSVFWLMTLINLKGIKFSTKIASLTSTTGMLLPIVFIISLGLWWIVSGKPLALDFNTANIVPHLNHFGSWASLTAIITSFLGMELATVHVKKIKNSNTIFSKAMLCTIIIIILTMGLGSLVVAMIVPKHDIVMVTGTVNAFSVLFNGFHLGYLTKVLGFMLIFGVLGAMINWLISPANGLAQAAKDKFLPQSLATENKNGVPSNILFFQGIVVTLVSSAFFLMPSINGSYWLLLDLSTELYLAMYIIMFVVAWKLLCKAEKIHVIPGGKPVAMLLVISGLIGSCTAFVVGFFPPGGVNVGSSAHYLTIFTSGLLLMSLPALLLKYYKAKAE